MKRITTGKILKFLCFMGLMSVCKYELQYKLMERVSVYVSTLPEIFYVFSCDFHTTTTAAAHGIIIMKNRLHNSYYIIYSQIFASERSEKIATTQIIAFSRLTIFFFFTHLPSLNSLSVYKFMFLHYLLYYFPQYNKNDT